MNEGIHRAHGQAVRRCWHGHDGGQGLKGPVLAVLVRDQRVGFAVGNIGRRLAHGGACGDPIAQLLHLGAAGALDEVFQKLVLRRAQTLFDSLDGEAFVRLARHDGGAGLAALEHVFGEAQVQAAALQLRSVAGRAAQQQHGQDVVFARSILHRHRRQAETRAALDPLGNERHLVVSELVALARHLAAVDELVEQAVLGVARLHDHARVAAAQEGGGAGEIEIGAFGLRIVALPARALQQRGDVVLEEHLPRLRRRHDAGQSRAAAERGGFQG